MEEGKEGDKQKERKDLRERNCGTAERKRTERYTVGRKERKVHKDRSFRRWREVNGRILA